MIKYCERCGTSLGECSTTKKWCKKCLKIVRNERQRKARKEKGIVPLGVTVCAFCGKPMQKKMGGQKYHAECSKKVQRRRALERYRKGEGNIGSRGCYKKVTTSEFEKAKSTPPKYTLKQINDKAKEYGMDYGHYMLALNQGKVDPPDER